MISDIIIYKYSEKSLYFTIYKIFIKFCTNLTCSNIFFKWKTTIFSIRFFLKVCYEKYDLIRVDYSLRMVCSKDYTGIQIYSVLLYLNNYRVGKVGSKILNTRFGLIKKKKSKINFDINLINVERNLG